MATLFITRLSYLLAVPANITPHSENESNFVCTILVMLLICTMISPRGEIRLTLRSIDQMSQFCCERNSPTCHFLLREPGFLLNAKFTEGYICQYNTQMVITLQCIRLVKTTVNPHTIQ